MCGFVVVLEPLFFIRVQVRTLGEVLRGDGDYKISRAELRI